MILLRHEARSKTGSLGWNSGRTITSSNPSPRELMVRVKTILRRANLDRSSGPTRLEVGGMIIDSTTREVITAGGQVLTLTATEFDLLRCLASYPRVVFSREQLMAQVWGYESAPHVGTSTVTVHVRRLREKLKTTLRDPGSSPRYGVSATGSNRDGQHRCRGGGDHGRRTSSLAPCCASSRRFAFNWRLWRFSPWYYPSGLFCCRER